MRMKESLLSHIKNEFEPLMFHRFSPNENSGILEPSRSLASIEEILQDNIELGKEESKQELALNEEIKEEVIRRSATI